MATPTKRSGTRKSTGLEAARKAGARRAPASAKPRAPFLVTVAAASAMALAALPGCGSTVSAGCPEAAPASGGSCAAEGQVCGYGADGCGWPIEYTCNGEAWEMTGDVGTCNPPPPQCPEATPGQGQACAMVSLVCTYPGDGDCVLGVTATCGDDSTWVVVQDVGSCNPPACPVDVPEAGAPCEPTWEPVCSYTVDTGCGPMDAQATCESGAWEVAIPTCNPPPPEYCFTLATEAECDGVSPFCRWLTPGCADPGTPPPPLAQAGCFPSFDCASSAECPAGMTCAEAVYNPCYMQACDACGAVANLCQ